MKFFLSQLLCSISRYTYAKIMYKFLLDVNLKNAVNYVKYVKSIALDL
jgi:hypothetical protein